MSVSQDEIPPPPPPPPSSSQTPTQQTPHTVSTIKLPILKKGEYDIWAIKMEHYLAITDFPSLGSYTNRNGPVIKSLQRHQDKIKVLPPRTAEEIVAREREEKSKDHIAYALTEASSAKSASKGYDRFQSLLKSLEIQEQLPSTGIMRTWNSLMNYELEGMALIVASGHDLNEIWKKVLQEDCRKLQFDAKRTCWLDKTNEVGCMNSETRGWRTELDSKEDLVKAWVTMMRDRCGLDKIIQKIRLCFDGLQQLNSKHREIKAYFQGLKYDGILSYENEVLQSVFMNKESDLENQPLYDRFGTTDGMHVVPPPMTGNYMPSGPDIEVDYSQFTYGPKQTQTSESESQTSEFDACESNISTEPSELVSESVVNESNVDCQPKVWSDAPIIEEYESDSEDEYVSTPIKEKETPSFANQQVKTPRETVKNQCTHSQKSKVDKKELGYRFTVRACFVCGSLNHLIRDCDFHEKRMARKAELNNDWNNVQRVNKQNQFVPSAVLTRTGKIPVSTARASSTKNVSTARQSFNRQTVLTSTAMKVNTVKPIVNRVRPANVFYKTHSPSSRPFKKTTVLRTDFSKQKVNTGKDYPHRALKNKGIVDSGCSRHMTGNKAYLDEFQDFNGGPVAFGGSRGYITGKVSYAFSL
ncbi:hypothetical protein Tco_0670431 [Tanacetum coccineum]